MSHPRVYALLKWLGHSPLKALEIVIAARRGDEHALAWVRVGFRLRDVPRSRIDAATGRI